jgi:signal transduction histidine kinase
MQTAQPRTVLIIEDDEELRFSLVLALEDAGYRVKASAASDEGLRLAREHQPAVIVCDVHLREGDGRALLKTLRQDGDLASCQFVLMTGDVKGAPQRTGMELGADDYLAKPFTIDEFLRCVETRFRRSEIYRQAEERALRWLRETVSRKLPHELFTPLNGILGLSEVLRDDIGTVPANVAREMATDIQRAAERLYRTLKNYLTILDMRDQQVAASVLNERTEAADVRIMVTSAARTAAAAHRREKDLVIECAETELPVAVNNLTAIVTELIDNACKYSKADTPVALRVRSNAAEAELAVFDHGHGMTPAQIAQIGAFRQFDRSKYEQQGLGLGLTLAQHLVERNGGTVRIESVPGQSTLVTATWPIKPPKRIH